MMNRLLTTGLMLILAILTISCSGGSVYNSPDSQRERAKEAHGELNQATQ